MSKKKVLTEDDIFKILKKFTVECVHGSDFNQGNTLEDTLSVMKTWWNKEKHQLINNENWFDLTFNEKLLKTHEAVLFPELLDKNITDFLSMIIQKLIDKTDGMSNDEINNYFE